MKPTVKLAAFETDDGLRLELFEHDGDHEIRCNGLGLMESRKHHSEEELARLGLEGVEAGATVMIGGLGMGYTLRAALDLLPPQARAIQVELLPAIVEWNRGPLAHHARYPLDDPRTELVIADFAQEVARHRGTLDAILVDIDNGPSALVDEKNAWVYTDPGLTVMRRALAPGGRVAWWSAYDEPGFRARLRSHGFTVEQHTVHARPNRRGPKYFVLVGAT
ncbi:MAG: spermidine synthase [Planctomycetota bacterium]